MFIQHFIAVILTQSKPLNYTLPGQGLYRYLQRPAFETLGLCYSIIWSFGLKQN